MWFHRRALKSDAVHRYIKILCGASSKKIQKNFEGSKVKKIMPITTNTSSKTTTTQRDFREGNGHATWKRGRPRDLEMKCSFLRSGLFVVDSSEANNPKSDYYCHSWANGHKIFFNLQASRRCLLSKKPALKWLILIARLREEIELSEEGRSGSSRCFWGCWPQKSRRQTGRISGRTFWSWQGTIRQ